MATIAASINFYFRGDAIAIPTGHQVLVRFADGSELRGKLRGVFGTATVMVTRDGEETTDSIPVSHIVGIADLDGKNPVIHQDRVQKAVAQ